MSERTFAEFIRTIRESAGLSQRALAEESGLSNGYISLIEGGLLPSWDKARRILDALDADEETRLLALERHSYERDCQEYGRNQADFFRRTRK